MATVVVDIIEGDSGKLTKYGWEFYRKVIVKGLTISDKAARIYTAYNTAGVPQRNDAHPSVADCILLEVDAKALAHNVVEFNMTYREPQNDYNPSDDDDYEVIESGATVSQEDARTDINGTLITVGYTPTGGSLSTKSRAVPKYNADMTIVFTRREDQDPGDKAEEYVGTVNDGSWDLAPGAYKHTWMCMGITGRSDDGGLSYLVTYTFAKRKKFELPGGTEAYGGWDILTTWTDDETHEVPTDAAVGNGLQVYQVQEEKDFDGLNLG